MFGHPNSRPRSWRIVYDPRRKEWCSKYSLDQLAKILLHDPSKPLKLTWEAYFVATRAELDFHNVYECDLSESVTQMFLKLVCSSFLFAIYIA